jgi:hypothetical protein
MYFMKNLTAYTSRFIALLLLISFTFVSCYNPIVHTGQFTPNPTPPPAVIITPGEGTPRTVYLDADLNVTSIDSGRTALYVEDNKNAEGVTIVADKVDDEDRVVIHNRNNNSAISLFFKPDSNFPYYMVIREGQEVINAYLSEYKTASSSYDIIFRHDDEFYSRPVVLNSSILNLYEDDPAVSASQNLRLRNITIALGLCGSLYNVFQDMTLNARWITFKEFLDGVKKVFTAVSVIATVVAVIVAPIVSFINPVAGAVVASIAKIVIEVSVAVLLGISALDPILDDKAPEKITVPVLNVTNVQNNSPLKNGEEFHIGMGKSITLEFYSPGMDSDTITLAQLIGNQKDVINYLGWEPGNKIYPGTANSAFFAMTLEKVNKERFRVTIGRISYAGYIEDGKVAYGFRFANNADVYINGDIQPVEHKFFDEQQPSIRKDTVVLNICVNPKCPDYVD